MNEAFLAQTAINAALKTQIQDSTNDTQSSIHEQSWVISNSKKRTRLSSVKITKTRKQSKLKNYWFGTSIPTSNRFEMFTQDAQDEDEEEESLTKKTSKFSPIFIVRVNNIQSLTNLLGTYSQK